MALGTKMRLLPTVRALRVDLSKTLLSRWFIIALLATLFSLWLSVARELRYLPDMLMYNDEPDWAGFLIQATQGSFAALTLPAFSALPGAGLALLELQTGAARSSIFRSSWRPYVYSKTISVLLSGMAVQAGAMLALIAVMQGIRLYALGQPIPLNLLAAAASPLLSRVLSGGIWAGVGSLLALLTSTSSAAAVGPLCLYYALMMIGTRFFSAIPAINPVEWLSSFAPWLLVLFAMTGLALLLTHRRKVRAYV